MAINIEMVQIQLANVKQELGWHRDVRESPIPAHDPIVHLHNAIQALEIALESLVREIEKDQS